MNIEYALCRIAQLFIQERNITYKLEKAYLTIIIIWYDYVYAY